MVCGAEQTLIHPARLGLRPGLDLPLHPDRHRWLAAVAPSAPQQGDAVLVGPAGPEFCLVAHLLLGTSGRIGPGGRVAASGNDRRLHRAGLATGSDRLSPLPALRRLGGLRLGLERRDLAPELRSIPWRAA